MKGFIMTTTLHSVHPKRRLPRLSAFIAFIAAVMFVATPANAATLDVDYDVDGFTKIAKTGSTIILGPAVMHSAVEGIGSFTGEMQLPGTRTEFKLLGFIPVSADVNFQPVGDGATTGELKVVDGRIELHSTTSYYVQLRNIKAVGLPLFAGPNCRTSQPVVINANTPTGERFNITQGGRLTGSYDIGNFQNCGLNTWLINQLIPGGGNTVELNLTNGRLAN